MNITQGMVEKAAAAIANARGWRRGAPPITNILEILAETHPDTHAQLLEEARAAIEAVGMAEQPLVRTAEITPDERKLLYYFAGYLRAALGLPKFDRRLFYLTGVFVSDFNARPEDARADVARSAELETKSK